MSKAECLAVSIGYAVLALIFGRAAGNADGWLSWFVYAVLCWGCVWVFAAYGVRLFANK